jgi:hypothetical protein
MPFSATLTIGGIAYDASGRKTARMRLDSLRAVVRDGVPILSFFVHSSSLAAAPDPFLGRSVSLAINGTSYFAGDVTHHLPVKSPETRWNHHYTCEGLRARGERFGVYDDTYLTDQARYNLPSTDQDYVLARAGRTVGQVVMSVVELPTNSANLAANGLCAFTSAGSGGAATAALTGGSVSTAFTITSAGGGYTTAPTIVLAGGGGSGATAHATVSGGGIASIIRDSAGSGYTSPPAVIISRLPTATVQDLAALNFIPPYPCTIQGEKFLSGVEAFFKTNHPNHHLHVQPDGTLRFWDIRKYGGTVANFSGGGGVGALAVPTVSPTGVVTALLLIHGGRGYTSAPTITITGPTGSGATATATVSGGQVVSVSLTGGGTLYAEGRTANVYLDIHPTDPPHIQEDISQCYSRLTCRGAPFIDGKEVRISDGTCTEDFDHDGLTSSGSPTPKSKWKWSDFNQPGAMPGAAVGAATLATAGVASLTLTNGGTGYTTAPTVTISGGGGSGATATATVSGGAVTSLTLTAGGSGFSTTPTVSFSGGGGAGAHATAALPTRAVASLTILDGGYGYTSAPAVSFNGGGGSGATATAGVSSGAVNSLTLGSGGSGYTTAPAVRVGGPISPTQDFGTATCPDTQTVRVTSEDATKFWASNTWDQTVAGRHGVLLLSSSSVAGLNSKIMRRVVANTALTAGGTSDLTVDDPLPHTNFDTYTLYGVAGGGSIVWRKYKVTDPAIASAMTDQPMTYGVPYTSPDGSSVSQTTEKACYICYSANGSPPYQMAPMFFDIDSTSGTLLTAKPVVWVYGTMANLIKGGSFTDGIPSDVRFLLPTYVDNLKVTVAADSGSPLAPTYTGTFHTLYGGPLSIDRTLTITVPEWKDKSQTAAMTVFANGYLDSVKDVVYEGSLPWDDLFEAALTPGLVVNILANNGSSYTTGWETISLPCISSDLECHAVGALQGTTGLELSNRRIPLTAAARLAPPMVRPEAFLGSMGWGSGIVYGAGASGGATGGYNPLGGTDAMLGGIGAAQDATSKFGGEDYLNSPLMADLLGKPDSVGPKSGINSKDDRSPSEVMSEGAKAAEERPDLHPAMAGPTAADKQQRMADSMPSGMPFAGAATKLPELQEFSKESTTPDAGRMPLQPANSDRMRGDALDKGLETFHQNAVAEPEKRDAARQEFLGGDDPAKGFRIDAAPEVPTAELDTAEGRQLPAEVGG